MTTLEEILLKNMSKLCKKQGDFLFLEVKAQVVTPKFWIWTNTVGLAICWCEYVMSQGLLGLCCGGTRAWLCRAG